jgi:hypothetical protein
MTGLYFGGPYIFNNRDNICSPRSHVDQVTARAVGEFHSIHSAGRANEIRDVRYTGSGRSTEVQDFRARLHVDGIETCSVC